MFRKYFHLMIGILIGSLITCGIVFADDIRTFVAHEAQFPVVVDGTPIKLDMPVVTIEDRTYLPLRALGDVLGVKVDWNEEKQQAEIAKTLPPSTEQDETTQGFKYENAEGYLYGIITDSSGGKYAAVRELAEKSNFDDKNRLDLMFDEKTGSACITKTYYKYECSQIEWDSLIKSDDLYSVKDYICRINLLKNIPVVLYNDRSYISLDYYENVMLPIIKANQ